MNILVVDDDPRARLIVRSILERMGAKRVVEAEDGEKALEVLRTSGFGFDAVLVDWLMPRLSGIDFARAVAEDPAGRRLPLIMVTGESDPTSIAEAFYAGVKGYIVKPFTPETVRRKVREVTAARALEDTAAIGAGGRLSGRIEGVGLQEVVQFIHTGKRTGTLAVFDGAREVGRLRFLRGEVQDATAGAASGEVAFYELAGLSAGRYEFEAKEEPGGRPPSIATPTVLLLIEAMRRRDQSEEGKGGAHGG